MKILAMADFALAALNVALGIGNISAGEPYGAQIAVAVLCFGCGLVAMHD